VFESIHSQRPMKTRSLLWSAAAHATAVVLLFALSGPALEFVAPRQHVALVAPRPLPKLFPRSPGPFRSAILPPAVKPPAAKLPEARLAIPQIELPQPPALEPVRAAVQAPDLPRPIPPAAQPIKTGEFPQAAISSQAPSKAATHLATGEFGSAAKSAPVLPSGTVTTASAGFTGPTAAVATRKQGLLQQAGFASSITAGNTSLLEATVHKGAFGDIAREDPLPAARKSAAGPASTSVEILSKSRPEYTPEARALAIEGEVLLEVLFEANGTARVSRILRGLGHGLDESAVTAARGIHFRPATRDGTAIDSTATVHIVFQLSY
jgi:TonB family protein